MKTIKYSFLVLMLLFSFGQLIADTIPGPYEIFVYVGNPDGSPIIGIPGKLLQVPLWFKTGKYVSGTSINLVLRTEDQYIVQDSTNKYGHIFWPFNQWDQREFYSKWEVVADTTRQSHIKIFRGSADLGGNPNPSLMIQTPQKCLEFSFQLRNDPGLIGDTVDCISINGQYSYIGDTTGGPGYNLISKVSKLHFIADSSK